MYSKCKNRLGAESGFTLIELLIVLVIIGILLLIAVPSYLGFKQRAEVAAVKSNIREALPSAEVYYSDFGNYSGLSEATMRSVDSGLASGGTWLVTPGLSSYTLKWTDSSGCSATITRPTPGLITTSGC